MNRSATARPEGARAFSIIEVLVVIGVLFVLVGIALPLLSRSVSKARGVGSLSRARQMGLAVSDFAAGHKDEVPVLFAPKYALAYEEQEQIPLLGRVLRGNWFDNRGRYHNALPDYLPADVLAEPECEFDQFPTRSGTVTSLATNYHLAGTFYAEPAFFNLPTQRGPEQWRAQKLGAVAFPSLKGMIRQSMVFSESGWRQGFPACCTGDVKSAIIWADLSGTMDVQGNLRPGVPNFWGSTSGPLTYLDTGIPIDATQDGNLGRDK